MSLKRGRIALVDSGFWYAVFDRQDQHHNEAQGYAELILDYTFIVPWPVVYETLCTRFVRRKTIIQRFEHVIKRPNAVLLDDSPYKEAAFEATLSGIGKNYSVVDNVLRMIMSDVNINVKILFSFNHSDFQDICARRGIEMI